MEHNYDERIIKQNPMLNNCVLQNVLQYMNVSELKEFRKVNSTWNMEAMLWLKKKSVVRFEYDYNNPEELLSEWKTQVSSYVDIMKYLKIEGFSFEMFPNGKSEEERKDCATKLATFVKDFGHEIKYLELTYRPRFEGEIKALENMLSCIRKPSVLTHLKLNIVVEIGFKNYLQDLQIIKNTWNNFLCEELTSIQRLELFFSYTAAWDKDVYGIIAEKICDLFPKLKSLEINSQNQYHFNNQLSIETCNRLETLGSLKDTGRMVPVPHIDFIKSLSISFPNLSRLDIFFPVVNTATEIQNLFDRQAPTLEEFTFWIPAVYLHRHQQQQAVEIFFPFFPNLKKLDVKRCSGNFNCLAFRFLDDSINYKTQFPKLTELTLGNSPFCERDGRDWKFLEMFIPLSEDNACEQIKVLNVPFLKFNANDKVIVYPHLYPLEVMSRLARMFPSIRNPYLSFSVQKYNELIPYLTDDSKKKNLRIRKPISYSSSKK